MPKLNQIIAVVSGKRSRTQKFLTDAHRWNKDAISGVVRTYRPKDEDGEKLPAESKQVHLDVKSIVGDVQRSLVDFWDAVATQETGNTAATANIVVNDDLLLSDVPVTILLFLEKQVEDLRTFIGNLPTLPPDREWTFDGNRNCYRTENVQTVRTQKIPKVIVKYDATEHHPAQTELVGQDVIVGEWDTVHLSSAIPAQEKETMMRRIVALSEAIKTAREEANSDEVEQVKIGQRIMEYVFPNPSN